MSDFPDIEPDDKAMGARTPPQSGGADGPQKLTFSVRTRDAFFDRVASQLRTTLPVHYARFHARPMFFLMKIAFDNERVHYEVGIDNAKRTLEIALHFEDGPASTLRYLALLDSRIIEIKHALGHQVDLERWTMSWARIYELWPLESLDRSTADAVAARLREYISILQPLLDEAGIAPERSAGVHTAPRRKGAS